MPWLVRGNQGTRVELVASPTHLFQNIPENCSRTRVAAPGPKGPYLLPLFPGNLVNRARATLHERLDCRLQAVARTILCLLQAYYDHRWCLCRGFLAGSGAAKVDAPKKWVNEIQKRYWG